MGRLIMPKHTADIDYIISALKVYYLHEDWLSNADFKDLLFSELQRIGKESVRSIDGSHYTKCAENLRYFGLLARRTSGSANSDVKITDSGKLFYEAFIAGEFQKTQEIIINSLETLTFGRNNEGCGSDSDLEPPCIFMLSSLLLDGLTNKEFAYILGCLNDYSEDLATVLTRVQIKRKKNDNDLPSSITSDIKFLGFLKHIKFLVLSDDYLMINQDVIRKYGDRIAALKIRNITSSATIYGRNNVNSANSLTSFFVINNIDPLKIIQTKPFILLAGISGTGKSRLVRELAFKSCPSYLQDKEGTTPGNYCMIEVKPNWHDSSELVGYYSHISKQYMFTKFVKFLVKALMYPDVPFFVCLDEMNLAPVEQYFAEYLSVLETRKLEDGSVKTGKLISAEYFHDLHKKDADELCENNGDVFDKWWEMDSENVDDFVAVSDSLLQDGLTLPENVFVIGTVNMDDTTHKFSRKVIDRAMTIEMNGGKLEEMFGGSEALKYLPDSQILTMDRLRTKYVSADDAVEHCKRMQDGDAKQYVTGKKTDGETVTGMETLPQKLYDINHILENTPFQVSYRVFNELVIYLAVLLDEDDKNMSLEDLSAIALDDITLMKILPRIEGDYEMFNQTDGENKLVSLRNLFKPDTNSYRKLDEMNERLKLTEFTRFWP